MIRRPIIPHLSILALIAALAAVSWQALRVLERSAPEAALKHETADRVLAYRVTHDRGLRFLLDGGRPRFKLSSIGVVPNPRGYDPSIQLTYRIGLKVSHLGRELWKADVAITSRQSKADWDGTEWAHEGVWSLEPIQLTDERITILELPEVPVDSILELRLIGDGEALLRAFQAETRDAAARERAAVRWDDQTKAELLRSSTYVPWSLLEPMERERRLTHRWQRLSALGSAGVDFETRPVFVSDFRTSYSSDDAEGIELSRGRAAALNVLGPAKVLIVTPPGSTTPLRIETIGLTLRSYQSAGGPVTVEVPDGPHSVIVSTDSPMPITVRARSEHEHWIVPLERRAATPVGQIVPDHVRIPMLMIGPSVVATVPIYDLADAGLLGRALRVDARLVGAPGRDPAPVQATIRVTFRGKDGRELGHDSIAITGATARFERLEWDGVNAAIAEPSTFRVIGPVGATSVDLSADRDLAISLFRWLPGDLERKQPYTTPPGPALAWRYAPLLHRSWFAVSPENHEELAVARRVALLDAQVRIDVNDDNERWASAGEMPSPGSAVDYETLKVPGTEQQRGREPVAVEDVGELLRTWESGALTELAPHQPRSLDFRAALRTRPRLSWAAPTAALGSVVQVMIGGVPRTVRLDSAFGSAELPEIAAGQHRVVIEAPLGVQLWINRPPVSERWGMYRDRTLYALGRQPIAVSIAQVPGEQIHLYAVVYADAKSTARVHFTVDGGKPKRREGVVERLTLADSIIEIASAKTPAARLIDLGGRWAGTPRVVHIGLLDDLAEGTHRVQITALSGSPLWIRLVATRDLRGAVGLNPLKPPPGGAP